MQKLSPIFPLPLSPNFTPYRHHLFPRPLKYTMCFSSVNCWNMNTLNTSSNTIIFLSGCFIDCLTEGIYCIDQCGTFLFLGNCKSFFFFEFGNYRSLHILVVSAWVIRPETKTWIINLFHSFDYRDWFKDAHQLN